MHRVFIECYSSLTICEGCSFTCFYITQTRGGQIKVGVKNVLASFGTTLSQAQTNKLHLPKEILQVQEIVVWFDRDPSNQTAQQHIMATLRADNLPVSGFD